MNYPILTRHWCFISLPHSRYWQFFDSKKPFLLVFFLPPGPLVDFLCWALFPSLLRGNVTQGPASCHSWASSSRFRVSIFKDRARAHPFLLYWDLCMYLVESLALHVTQRCHLFSSSISAWAICTFFWVPYLNYWHNYQTNSPSQKCGRHHQHSFLFSITNSCEFHLLNRSLLLPPLSASTDL